MKIDQRVRHATASKHELEALPPGCRGRGTVYKDVSQCPRAACNATGVGRGTVLEGITRGSCSPPMKAYAYSMAGCKSAKRLVRIDARGYADSPSKTPHRVQALLDSGHQAGERA